MALMPFCYIGGFTLSAMPAIFVIQGDFSPFTTQIGGLVTCGISLIQAGAMMHIVLGRDPLDLGQVTSAIKLSSGGHYVKANGTPAKEKKLDGEY
ncbi:putative membrane protein [Seiridium cupressi]